MKHLKIFSTLVAIIGGLTSTSQASLVLPAGGAGALGSTAIAGGATLVTSLTSTFADPGSPSHFSGELITKVWSGDANNTLGGYTFEYILKNDSTSLDGLARMTVNGWINAGSVNVDNVGTALSALAATADRTPSGDTIGFQWFVASPANARIAAGGFGDVIVQTALSYWAPTSASVIDGGNASVAALAVPEPTTIVAGALLLLPFGASTLRILRKNRIA